jgi:hypothetical protein
MTWSRVRAMGSIVAMTLGACAHDGSDANAVGAEGGGDGTDGVDWPGDTDDPFGDTGGGDTGAVDTGGGDVDPVCDGPVGAAACAAITRCEAYGCGGKSEGLDHYGCARRSCVAHDECAATERCYAVALDETCLPSEESCVDMGGVCECVATDDCMGTYAAHCLPLEVYPLEEDCDPTAWPCDELFARQLAVVDAFARHVGEGNTDLATDLGQCSLRLASARVAERCGEAPCQIVCELGSCSAHADVEECVTACTAVLAEQGAAPIESVMEALAVSPPLDGECACTACDGLDTDFCTGLWAC